MSPFLPGPGFCQHDQTKPAPTVVPLGSAAFGSDKWLWMCRCCGQRFELPLGIASASDSAGDSRAEG